MTVHPAYVLAFDLLLVFALIWAGRSQGYWSTISGGAFGVSGAVAALLLSIGATTLPTKGITSRISDAIVFDRYDHDFGDVTSLAKVTHEFRMSNTGAEPIEIIGARSTCSCSTADGITGLSIPSGGSLLIPVTIRVAEDESQQFGDVTILFRSLVNQEVGSRTVRVLASPKPDYRIAPRSRFLDLGRVEPNNNRTHLIELEPLFEPQSRFLSGVTSDKRVAVNLSEDGRRAEVQVRAQDGERSGDIAGIISLTTNSARQPKCTVYVQGECRPAVEVLPRSITISSGLKGSQDCELRVSTGTLGLILKEAKATDARVSVKVLESPSPDGQRILVSIPDTGPTPFAAQLQIIFDVPGSQQDRREERVMVPIFRLGSSN